MAHATDDLIQTWLMQVYQENQAHQGFSLQQKAAMRRNQICAAYGELHYYSVKKLMERAQLKSSDRLLDLGSGLGKFALQIFVQSDVQKVIGIEAISALHQQAVDALARVKAEQPFLWTDQHDIQFYEGNFLELDWHHANVVYSCSTCFSQDLLNAIGEKVNAQPQVEQVFSLRPLPTLKMPLKDIFGVECSWDSALCYHYAT